MMTLDQHIEELRAELRNCCCAKERREITAELNAALAQREQRADKGDEPPS